MQQSRLAMMSVERGDHVRHDELNRHVTVLSTHEALGIIRRGLTG
jgi:hypothetical protein